MKITKRQLKRIIREEYTLLKRKGLIREGRMKEAYGEMQNDILELAQNQGGSIATHEATSAFGSRMGMTDEDMLQVLMDMVDGGMLRRTPDYQDQYRMGLEMVAFTVHPDYY